MTYSEAEHISLAFGTALVRENLVPEETFEDEMYQAAQKMRLVGIYARNCVEWFLAEQACNAYGLALCPLYDTLGEDSMDFILQQSSNSIKCNCIYLFPPRIVILTHLPNMIFVYDIRIRYSYTIIGIFTSLYN